MFTSSQKIRVFIYIVLVPILLFSLPIINQILEKKPPVEEKNTSKTQIVSTIKVISSKENVVFSDQGSNIWTNVDKISQIKPNSNIATLGNDSGVLLKTPDNAFIALGSKTKISISNTQESQLLIKPSYGCFGLYSEDPAGKDVNIFFLSGIKKIKIANKVIFCKKDEDTELVESENDIFLDKEVFSAKRPSPKNISPCYDIIEVDDASGATASVLLSFIAPSIVPKSVYVSTNPEFTDNVFTSKIHSFDVRTSPLNRGQYYWRVKNDVTGELSQTCPFEVVYHKDISLVSPKNDEVVVDNSIEFSWNKISGIDKYNLTITKDFSKAIQSTVVNTNNLKIDDPLQTLGPGSYYWKVETKKGKASPYRRFFIYTGNDLIVVSPRYDDVFKPADKFSIINWTPLPMVKSYSVLISSSPSFVSSEYANTTTQPFLFVESMKEGKYYLKISAVFENNTKITSDVIPFSFNDIPDLTILDPAPGSSKDVSTERLMKASWAPITNAIEYLVIVNGEKPVSVVGDKTEADILVNLGGNRIQIEAYCGSQTQKSLCAKSNSLEFSIGNIIEATPPPIIKYPYNRKIFFGGYVSMEWSGSKGADGYKVEISKDKTFTDIKETELIKTKFNIQLKKGIYYWRVLSYTDKTGSKIYSKATETRLFIVK